MLASRISRLAAVALLVLCVGTVGGSFAAANVVPRTGVLDTRLPITPNALKPPECAALNLTAVRDASGTVVGSGQNQLILGTTGFDWLTGGIGDDCVVGGPGTDVLFGGDGNDVLLGGAGNDWLFGDGGIDACYGEGGTDYFDSSCETQIQ